MPHVAVTAVGADRPGIVAAVTGVLMDQGCNLEDTSMTILRGHFTMMLIVAVPDRLRPGALEEALAPVADELGLVVSVKPIDDDRPASPEGEAWSVAVYGGDRPGIVHAVAKLLADAGVNIVDLSTRVIGDPSRPVYAMLLDVTLPPSVAGAELQQRLDALGRELGVECSLHPADADVL